MFNRRNLRLDTHDGEIANAGPALTIAVCNVTPPRARDLSLRAAFLERARLPGGRRTIFKGDPLAYLRHRLLSTQMNQVPGAPSRSLVSFFFSSLSSAIAIPLYLPPSSPLSLDAFFFSYATGRSADLLSQLELVISLRHISVCTRAPDDKTNMCSTRVARFAPRFAQSGEREFVKGHE